MSLARAVGHAHFSLTASGAPIDPRIRDAPMTTVGGNWRFIAAGEDP